MCGGKSRIAGSRRGRREEQLRVDDRVDRGGVAVGERRELDALLLEEALQAGAVGSPLLVVPHSSAPVEQLEHRELHRAEAAEVEVGHRRAHVLEGHRLVVMLLRRDDRRRDQQRAEGVAAERDAGAHAALDEAEHLNEDDLVEVEADVEQPEGGDDLGEQLVRRLRVVGLGGLEVEEQPPAERPRVLVIVLVPRRRRCLRVRGIKSAGGQRYQKYYKYQKPRFLIPRVAHLDLPFCFAKC